MILSYSRDLTLTLLLTFSFSVLFTKLIHVSVHLVEILYLVFRDYNFCFIKLRFQNKVGSSRNISWELPMNANDALP